MKKSLVVPIILAIISHAYSISLGEILGMRRRWHDASFRTAVEPEVIEIVRWRQPVCVVPGKDVPPCLATIQKLQNDYQRNSDEEIEADKTKKISKKIVNERPGVLTPEVVDSFEFENVESVKIDSSEESGRGFDQAVTLNLRSRTPEIEVSDGTMGNRRGKYLTMSSFGKSTTVVHESPGAIYVTKVMNSPVTATLVAKNCFPDMGVPLCENYQETITIYRDPVSSQYGEKEITIKDTDRVADESETNVESAKENTGSPDFWTDPSNPNFDDGASHSEPQRPSGLLGQAIQHVISKPGVISAIPTGIIDAIANKPGILGGTEGTDKSGESSSIGNAATTVIETAIKPQVVERSDDRQRPEVTASSPRPGLIGSFLDIQRPAILENLFTSGLGIFNRSTTPKPEASVNGGGLSSGGLHGQGAGQGIGQGAGQGVGQGIGQGVGQVIGQGVGQVIGQGAGQGIGQGAGQVIGQGAGQVIGQGAGQVIGQGAGQGIGQGAGQGIGQGTGQGLGQGAGQGIGQGVGQGIGQSQVIQAIQNFINRPDKVSTNERPEFMPVLVVEPTQRPSLLGALWNPGSLGIFNQISASSASQPAGEAADAKVLENEQTESSRTDSSDVPARPQVSEASVKAENDVEKTTVAAGLFGGLFKNPAKPNALENSGVDNTKTVLGIGSSIFSRPKNKPLIIERPGAKPLLVEKPIYVQEKPVQSAGLLNFFIPASDKPLLSVAHEVIKDPVYVYQKPQTSSGILSSVFGENLSVPGFFQGWAIFGNDGEKKVENNQSIGDAVELSRTGENLRSAIDSQSETSTIDETRRENPESIATKSTPLESTDVASESERSEDSIDEEAIEEIVEALEEEGMEEVPKSYVDVNEPESDVIKILLPEETTVDESKVENRHLVSVDGPAKSANSLEEIPDSIASEVNAELAGPIEIEETAPKSTEEEKSSVDLSESLTSDSALQKIEDAKTLEEIVEKPERNLSAQSENVVKENTDDEDDESAIETDA